MKRDTFTDEIVSLSGHIKQMAYKMCQGNTENAKDIAQETLLKMLENKQLFRQGTNMISWAYAIMRNTYITQQNRETVYDTLTEESDDEPIEAPEISHFEILRCISYLPEELEWVILLRAEGYSYEFIASERNCAVSTVRGRLYTARRILQKMLSRY